MMSKKIVDKDPFFEESQIYLRAVNLFRNVQACRDILKSLSFFEPNRRLAWKQDLSSLRKMPRKRQLVGFKKKKCTWN